MKKLQGLILAAMCLLMAYSSTLRAEDIDIYLDGASTTGVPNVLFVMDNGANFSADAGGTGCAAYSGTSEPPSLGATSAAGILQCALVDAINSLPDTGVMNIGLVVSNANGFADTQATTDPTRGGYHALCSGSGVGGCVLRTLTLMNAANKASLIKFIKGWNSTNTTDADKFSIKVNSAKIGTTMQEAWAYYNGKTGLSGKTYPESFLGIGCQKNFIVYIGNTHKNPDNEANPSPQSAMADAQVGATDAQKLPVTGTVTFNPPVCGGTKTYSLSSSTNWADEWARLMYQQDGGEPGNENRQNIVSYAIGIMGPANKCSDELIAVQSSIATQGGGQYFQTASVSELTKALKTVLNEVQAVNSVFSSASLPVSVNADGTYLNQIFLGMFRPDSTARPRWMGNLKQYQLVKNATGEYVMGDAAGNEAISSSGTGFISPTAVSIWTSATPDPAAPSGFWVNDKKGVPESGLDSPDGEVVEKGGVAQQLRKENLTADFSTTEGSSSNPRRLYTYCPSGSSCQPALTHADNTLSTGNTGISSADFGASTTILVNSIVRTGTEAVVTTKGAHGFTAGTAVTISGASHPAYNVTQTLNGAGLNATQFKITGLPDHPTSPSQGAYTIAVPGASSLAVTAMTLLDTDGATGTVKVWTSGAHGFTPGQMIEISGASSPYSNKFPISLPGVGDCLDNCFTYEVPLTPTTPALNSYQAAFQLQSFSISSIKGSGGTVTVETSADHGLHTGQTVTVAGAHAQLNGTYTITVTAGEPRKFTYSKSTTQSRTSGTVSVDTTGKAITMGITRAGITATAKGLPADWFGSAAGQTKKVTISKLSGSNANEGDYLGDFTVTCATPKCTEFTFPVIVSPSAQPSGAPIVAGPPSAVSAPIAPTNITRDGKTVTVKNLPANLFKAFNGQSLTLSTSGAGFDSEAAYVGTKTITCAVTDCSALTFQLQDADLTPATPAAGANIKAHSGSPPDKNTLIRWVRGEDNFGDEKGPGGSVKVRPSIHGDVLHSRPVVLNYSENKLVAFYGANDGVYRAVNAHKSAAIGSVPAGGELWGLVLPEHFIGLNRQRVNSPELRFPTTMLDDARPKDYFVDGPTGVYQRLNTDGTLNTAYLYLTMRRGGRFMYGLNVTNPVDPKVMWTRNAGDTGFEELGQTWSRPRVAVIQGGGTGIAGSAVLVFGAGYDSSQDSEPPGTDSMGRGIYVVNPATGALIWSATASCTTSATCRQVPGMKFAIPSDITFVDRDGDRRTDTLYFGDMGGNIWRADVSGATTDEWTVKKLAALGCDAAGDEPPCADGKAPRKFFFPPSVISVGMPGTGAYDLVSIPSGDREHPLKSTATGSSHFAKDKFFMILDETAAGGTATENVELPHLFNATSTEFTEEDGTPKDPTKKGFFINFANGEKGVNAPNAVNGYVFFATNRPVDTTKQCASNLGEAKNYAVSPFSGKHSSAVLDGGGLPPTSVSGVVRVTDPDGNTTSQEKFCIGCAVKCTGNKCSPLQNSPPGVTIKKQLKRTYWNRK